MAERIASYEEFWPFYVSEHRHPVNRGLHVVGTTLVYVCLVAAPFLGPLALVAAPVVGYGFAWAGHFGVEHNRPATFSYPLWSLRGDFRMHRLTLLGRMGPELQRAARLYPA
jgi:hypothetical protein